MKIEFVYKILPVFIFTGNWFNRFKFYRNATGITIGNCIVIKPDVSAFDYVLILRHEKVHTEQFYRYLGINGILYLFERFRIKLEAEAYAVQYDSRYFDTFYKSTKAIAENIKDNYAITKYSYEDVYREVMKARINHR